MGELKRMIRHSLKFYIERQKLIMLFSLPFLVSFTLLMFVPSPTYLAIGGMFSRTGSIPELSITDIILIGVAYIISLFVIADTIANVNLIIRAKRTKNVNSSEILSAMGNYATRIFYVYTIMILLVFVAQLLLYESPMRALLFPVLTFVLSALLFFVAPAVVIDGEGTAGAIAKSIGMALRKPFFIVSWSFIGLVLLSVPKIIFDLVLPHAASSFLVLLVNSLFVLPFLIVLQTQMYMEKYPLAR